jgi:predicted phage baseplate assembly protein
VVEWAPADALLTPYLIAASSDPGGRWPPDVPFTVARGNIAAADHGLRTGGTLTGPAPALPVGPLTVQCPPAGLAVDRHDLDCPVDAAVPAIELTAAGQRWTPVPDLLGSGPFDRVFVVEIDDGGIGRLRFGDGRHGARPPDTAEARWRVGSGSAGNIGAESLQHLVVEGPEQLWMRGASVRNPLDARGGQDPETIADIVGRLSLPGTTPRRAVTEADYVDAVRDVPGVAAAAATVRWTGSWYTAFVAVQPTDPRDLRNDCGGWELASDLAALIERRLEHVRLAGRDVEVRPPHPAGLDVALRVAVLPGYLAPDVVDAVTESLLARPRVLGGPVYLSQLLAAAQAVEGVASVTPDRFRRFGQPDSGELAVGVIRLGPFDLASFENDPDRPQLGVLRVAAEGDAA